MQNCSALNGSPSPYHPSSFSPAPSYRGLNGRGLRCDPLTCPHGLRLDCLVDDELGLDPAIFWIGTSKHSSDIGSDFDRCSLESSASSLETDVHHEEPSLWHNGSPSSEMKTELYRSNSPRCPDDEVCKLLLRSADSPTQRCSMSPMHHCSVSPVWNVTSSRKCKAIETTRHRPSLDLYKMQVSKLIFSSLFYVSACPCSFLFTNTKHLRDVQSVKFVPQE